MRYSALFILLLIVMPFLGFAQKAYQLKRYSGKLNGKTIRLNLADGFAGATAIIIPRKNGLAPVTYYANSGVPEANNTMLFQSKYLQKGDYFILDTIKQFYRDIPGVISGRYYFKKRITKVTFTLVK